MTVLFSVNHQLFIQGLNKPCVDYANSQEFSAHRQRNFSLSFSLILLDSLHDKEKFSSAWKIPFSGKPAL